MAGDEPRLVIYSARWRSGFIAYTCLAGAVALGWALAIYPVSVRSIPIALGVVVFGVGGLLAARGVIQPSRLVLTSAGFTVAGSWRWSVVPWCDVDEFFLVGSHGEEMAAWRYKPGREPPPVGALAKLLNNDGPPSVGSGWTQSPRRLVATLTEWRDRYGA